MFPTKLWNRNFLLLWLGQAQSVCGNILYTVALTYLALELTGTAKYTAFTMAAGMAPAVLSPLVGVMIDRINMKPYLVLGDLLRGFLMLSICYLLYYDQLTISLLIGSAFISGLVSVIYRPTFAAVLPKLVPKEDIARANAFNSLSSQIATLAGFVFGGILVAYIGTLWAILVNGLSFLVMSLLLTFIQFPNASQKSVDQSTLQDLKAGFQYLFASSFLVKIPFVFSMMGVGYAALEMLMPVKLKSLNYGADGFAVVFSTLLVGSIIASALFSKLGKNLNVNQHTPTGLIVMAVAVGGIALSGNLFFSCLFAFLYGIGSTVVSISAVTFIQTNVVDQFRGRIFSLFGVIEQTCMPVALLLVGKLTDLLSTEAILYVVAFSMLSVSLWWVFSLKKTQIILPSPNKEGFFSFE